MFEKNLFESSSQKDKKVQFDSKRDDTWIILLNGI